VHDGIAEMACQVHTELQDLSTDLRAGGSIFRKESNPRMSRKAANPSNAHKGSKPKLAHKAKAKKRR
jgi:hypothetical protein